MDLVLCHTTADFDTLGAAVAVTLLNPAAQIVLAGGAHPTVQRFLALHRDEYSLVERRAVDVNGVESITIVDTQFVERLGPLAPWIATVTDRGGRIAVYDHHPAANGTIPATETVIESVGAATTLLVERLQAEVVSITVAQATVMALGIHVDTGSLTFTSATARDALALAWLMEQGASQSAIAEFVEPNLSSTLQDLLETALATYQQIRHQGSSLGWVLLETKWYVPGLSSLAERLISLINVDSFLLGAWFLTKGGVKKLTLIGRAQSRVMRRGDRAGVDFNELFSPWGGGGHPAAAAVTRTTDDPEADFQVVLSDLRSQIPAAPTAQDLMSSPVRTILPKTTVAEAQRILLRYGHSGLSVVDNAGQLVGVISRRDVDLALHHGFGHAPVKGYMSTEVKTISPKTTLPEIESMMVTYDVGRLPVLDSEKLVGIVTRTDLLRQLHDDQQQEADFEMTEAATSSTRRPPAASQLWHSLKQRLDSELWEMLEIMAAAAVDRGWQLYLVGGGVRDLFLTPTSEPLKLQDVDLVVDSAYQTLEMGAGVVLAETIKAQHPEAELQVYGRFQTAALVWHGDAAQNRDPLMVDIATARTEFYPYPAANPEVEASSIRQDLYRRDFTINALAVRLTPPHRGKLLDFFGGLDDLQRQQIRVLHANSFIEDPTRIYRAVRFAVRLGFTLEPQTEGFIRYAIKSEVYQRLQKEMTKLPALQTRLKAELNYILEAAYWEPALSLLDSLEALVCLHPSLAMTNDLWRQMRLLSRWLSQVELLSSLVPWQMRLELLIAAVPSDDRQRVARHLQLPQASIDRLAYLMESEATLLAALPQCDRPSQFAQCLKPYDTETLLLVSARHFRPLGSTIWRYLTQWSQVKPLLNGNDLKQLGYQPGPQYREMLDTLLSATLDGTIANREAAIVLLRQHYPEMPKRS
ncbi:CBS domain-containing protein [Oscillatoria sp. CS-180]|uniref:CBS domain-containing protein n=1 Tax=Oscillatoria sp. CS-180 TaxID=3021720 RepID=UPI00232F5752|nr:CBS domain-containing protein [Oscillatoria sp. CS-180]MDB9527677.1 CBS domain-containing protein [Oscillatoria sp. CS-180]